MRKIAFILLALLLEACGDESDIQNAVRARLKDPDSAKFGTYQTFKSAKGETFACIEINAKNSMGGYSGR